MLELIADPQVWIALFTLIAIEIVLGIDNIIFISIVVEDLPEGEQQRARFIGLGLALIARVIFLLMITWIIGLTAPVFELFDHAFSWRDLILIGGGLFLLAKSTLEIHGAIDTNGHAHGAAKKVATFAAVILQILIIDIIFSIDSVITAIGMARDVEVMIAAVIVAILFMLFFSEIVSRFVEKYPTIKMLALSFLVMVGFTLVADGFGFHIPKPYIYVAMGFSLGVEALNIMVRNARARSS